MHAQAISYTCKCRLRATVYSIYATQSQFRVTHKTHDKRMIVPVCTKFPFYGRVNTEFHRRGLLRMNAEKIPDIIIGRLPVYLRALQRLSDKGIYTTSSQELGAIVGISAAQIRKDISQFGEFGKQGTGYAIPYLIERLQDILKVDRVWDVVIVGMGDVGHALARYQGFATRGFIIKTLF